MISVVAIVFHALVLKQFAQAITRIDPLVDTKVGLIRGLTSEDGSYSMFMGIPYANVNYSNPFGDAIPHTKFQDTFEAYDDGAICPQLYMFNETVLGNLDCLHLNIYVPSTATSKKPLPIMVWIHGGSFRRGFAGRYMYDPKFLVKHNVISVNINYRLGPYGFMCLDHPSVPGNQGLKDQTLALRWIKDNIEAFGGDPNEITVFGESAGGHSVDFHLLSNNEVLFHRAIIQSGSTEAGTVLIEPDIEAPIKLADYLGYQTSEIEEALNFLIAADTDLVIGAALDLNIMFKPCAENEFDGVNGFITKHWVNTEVPKVRKMPVLIGFNENELLINHVNKGNEHFTTLDIFRTYLEQTFTFTNEELDDMSQLVKNFYLGDNPISEDEKWNIIYYDSDFTYIHPIQRTINKFLKNGAGDIFYYMFAYDGGRNAFKIANGVNATGVSHFDELGYLFNMEYITGEITPEDKTMIDRMTTMWTNFAKYSNPTPETSELLPIKWEPVTKQKLNYLKIDAELSLGNRPLNHRMAFWDLFYKMNEEKQTYLEK
uniref:Carboxylic ester hydrolase n=1 Tax=Bombyx mori TaxID=7091 RepID=M1RGF2_BOMMO|nr:carboxylesterase ae17 [Bombyx mori]